MSRLPRDPASGVSVATGRVAYRSIGLALAFTLLATLPATARGIVLFLADDLGYADIGANNPSTFYETPHIDRLAETGMRFTDGYATCPVCSPSRYSIMTGKLPARGRVTDWFTGRRSGR